MPKKVPADEVVDEPVTVVSLTVDAYKRLEAAHVRPSPTGLVLVRGKNGAGKSSLIESMLDAFGVERAALPITQGHHAAHVVMQLGPAGGPATLEVVKDWMRDSAGAAKPALKIRPIDGAPIAGPAGVLKELRGHFADPVAFIEMSAGDQVKTVLSVMGMDERLAALEGEAEAHYNDRRDVGRDRDRLAKALLELEGEVGCPPEPRAQGTLEEASAALRDAERHNAAGLEARRAMTQAAARGKEASDRRARLAAELEKLEVEILERRRDWQEAAEMAKSLEQVDTAPLLAAVHAHEVAAKGAGKRELLESKRAEYDAADGMWQQAERGLEGARAEIQKLLADAQFPVDAMSYDAAQKTLMIGEVPFGQASQAEKLRAAAAVAMAGNPKIRVLFGREGSLLDEDSRAQLAALAEAAGFQLWLEVVDSNPEGGGIWIQEGQASQGGQA